MLALLQQASLKLMERAMMKQVCKPLNKHVNCKISTVSASLVSGETCCMGFFTYISRPQTMLRNAYCTTHKASSCLLSDTMCCMRVFLSKNCSFLANGAEPTGMCTRLTVLISKTRAASQTFFRQSHPISSELHISGWYQSGVLK